MSHILISFPQCFALTGFLHAPAALQELTESQQVWRWVRWRETFCSHSGGGEAASECKYNELKKKKVSVLQSVNLLYFFSKFFKSRICLLWLLAGIYNLKLKNESYFASILMVFWWITAQLLVQLWCWGTWQTTQAAALGLDMKWVQDCVKNVLTLFPVSPGLLVCTVV